MPSYCQTSEHHKFIWHHAAKPLQQTSSTQAHWFHFQWNLSEITINGQVNCFIANFFHVYRSFSSGTKIYVNTTHPYYSHFLWCNLIEFRKIWQEKYCFISTVHQPHRMMWWLWTIISIWEALGTLLANNHSMSSRTKCYWLGLLWFQVIYFVLYWIFKSLVNIILSTKKSLHSNDIHQTLWSEPYLCFTFTSNVLYKNRTSNVCKYKIGKKHLLLLKYHF